MEKITITEALSEINLIKKKIEKKKEVVVANLARAKHMPDPFYNQGGSAEAMRAELQSIIDLDERLITIRGRISKANSANSISIEGTERSINDWLTWKREVAEEENKFFMDICNKTKANMDHWAKSPQVYKDEEGKTHLVEFESNLDYALLLKGAEKAADIIEKLDGQLSLKNALIVVEV